MPSQPGSVSSELLSGVAVRLAGGSAERGAGPLRWLVAASLVGAVTVAVASVVVGSEPSASPTLVNATAAAADDGTWRFDVTLSSPYDTPERYADAWRVLAPDGTG